MVQRWSFHEPVTNETYTVEINPNDGGTPTYRKTITDEVSLSGNPILMEGASETQRIECSGVILDRSHLAGLVSVWRNSRQVRLTDDLGRQWWVYVEALEPSRKRSRRAWRHDYNLKCVVLSTVNEFGTVL